MEEKIHPQKRGRFIALEGIDGSGKSTQIRLLKNRLDSMGLACLETREPTDSPIGSLIRQFLTGRMTADNRVIATLFAADRTDHLLNGINGIVDRLNSGTNVIMDRYYFSSYAYHSVELDMDWVININSVSAEILRPDLTVFLDIPASTAMKRIQKGRFHTELFEKEERLRLVRDNYFKAFKKLADCEKVAVIDADEDEKIVAERIWAAVSEYFSK